MINTSAARPGPSRESNLRRLGSYRLSIGQRPFVKEVTDEQLRREAAHQELKLRAARGETVLSAGVIAGRVEVCLSVLHDLREELIAAGIKTPRETGMTMPAMPGDDMACARTWPLALPGN